EQAQAEINRFFETPDAAREITAASRRCDEAMEKLTDALAERDAAIEQYAATTRLPLGKEIAARLTNSSNVDIAWAWHELPGAVEIPERDMKPLAESDAELLGLKED